MIRIEKPADAPTVLRTQGARKRLALCSAYTRHRADYDGGAKTFRFEPAIYAQVTVKQALIAAQHGKCCFCESKITHIAYGDVEHFRPKAGFRQEEGEPLGRPGYYWLAYDWGNLYLCCRLCNQRHKRNLFPLADPGRRARSHHDDLGEESPLFLDPGTTDPEQWIGFRGEYIYAIDDHPAAHATIAALGLARTELEERRRDRLHLLAALADLIAAAGRHPADPELADDARHAERLLADACSPAAEYTALARCAVAANFTYR